MCHPMTGSPKAPSATTAPVSLTEKQSMQDVRRPEVSCQGHHGVDCGASILIPQARPSKSCFLEHWAKHWDSDKALSGKMQELPYSFRNPGFSTMRWSLNSINTTHRESSPMDQGPHTTDYGFLGIIPFSLSSQHWLQCKP